MVRLMCLTLYIIRPTAHLESPEHRRHCQPCKCRLLRDDGRLFPRSWKLPPLSSLRQKHHRSVMRTTEISVLVYIQSEKLTPKIFLKLNI